MSAGPLAKPQRKNAASALPSALENMTHGYAMRSERWPSTTWPTTPAALKSESTTVAVSGVATVCVKDAM